MTEFLSAEELRELTGYKNAGLQATWLSEQGICYRQVQRRTIVSRSHVHAWLEGRPVRSAGGINWAALEHAQAH